MKSVRTLHIIGSRQMGGAENFFLRLVTALEQQEQQTGVVIRNSSPLQQLLPEELTRCTVGMHGGWDLWSRHKITRIIKKFDPDIVQTYMGRASKLTHLPLSRRPVHIARLGGYYKIPGYYDHAHAWIGNTKGICDYLVREGLPAAKVFHIGNFVESPPDFSPESRLAIRKEMGIAADATVLFSLGRFIDKKGFADLLAAVALLRKERGATQKLLLVTAGDGPERGMLMQLAAEQGISDCCRFPGWLNDSSPFFAIADLFICPSREEPLGNVILEAWSHHLPVLTTDTAAAVELIDPGNNGLVCARQNPADMAAVLRELLVQPALRTNISAGGFATLQGRYSRDAIVSAYLDLYHSLL